jgi:hypothetical protein
MIQPATLSDRKQRGEQKSTYFNGDKLQFRMYVDVSKWTMKTL